MSNQTSDNEQATGRILDTIRMIGVIILLVHFYYFNYTFFRDLGLTNKIGDIILVFFHHTGLLSSFRTSKIVALFAVAISLLGGRGKKMPDLDPRAGFYTAAVGLVLY